MGLNAIYIQPAGHEPDISIINIRNAMQSLYRALHREGLCTQEESLHTPTRKIKQNTDRKANKGTVAYVDGDPHVKTPRTLPSS